MSTRSNGSLARQQPSSQQQQLQQQFIQPNSPPGEAHGLPSVPGRLTRKRAQSINVEEANHPRVEGLTIHSPALVSTPPPSATTTDLICICPAPPKVPRPRNAFILYRQHHQAGVVLKYPGLANPEISKIIGELWREETEEVKNYWKRLAEEEKARHQRQYPQYKYQPRRGGKGGPSARPASALGEDPGRCPKCQGRYIATPRTPSTPFMPGGHHGHPLGSSAMQPFLANNPRVVEQVQQHHRPLMDMGPPQLGGDPRRVQYYPQHQEQLRTIEENYDGMPPHMSKRRAAHDDYDMMSPADAKRRRVADRGRSPDPSVPPSQHPQHHQQSISSPVNYAAHNSGVRRTSSMSSSVYAGTPGSGTFGPGPMAPLPRPRMPTGPSGLQQDNTMMAPPPRPPRQFSTGAPPPSSSHTSRSNSAYDESLTLAPLQIPTSPTQTSDTSGARTLSGGGVTGLGIMNQQQGQSRDSQARGIEAMVMSIPYMNKLDVLRKISPPLGPPAPGSPFVETRGPVIAIEGANMALMREVMPVIERALRQSGECETKIWTDSSPAKQVGVSDAHSPGRKGDGEDAAMSGTQDKDSASTESRSGSLGSGITNPDASGTGNSSSHAMGTFNYLQTIMEWHSKSAEIIKHITTQQPAPAPSSKPLLPVALIPDGFSLTLSDKFASTVAITDPYSPVDHWQWMATLWRGIVGPDLVVYVRASTSEELARSGSSAVEYRSPGIMIVRVDAEKGAVDEKTERRLAFEVMEWVRAGSFRDGYAFGND
ncbi:HMG box protein [Diaporthe amygdali]|uniref:HMG box protein n=1 Tax=Phomopsis amygdali TaxID=1214568 RepID=UPI0022FEC183|nr:HMG box protein [Diaporthe amygdali]KAJ0125047.1 HMG box protein [Diaporthe amygdali]